MTLSVHNIQFAKVIRCHFVTNQPTLKKDQLSELYIPRGFVQVSLLLTTFFAYPFQTYSCRIYFCQTQFYQTYVCHTIHQVSFNSLVQTFTISKLDWTIRCYICNETKHCIETVQHFIETVHHSIETVQHFAKTV